MLNAVGAHNALDHCEELFQVRYFWHTTARCACACRIRPRHSRARDIATKLFGEAHQRLDTARAPLLADRTTVARAPAATLSGAATMQDRLLFRDGRHGPPMSDARRSSAWHDPDEVLRHAR